MKRNGTTSAGRARWRCKDSSCGVSRTRRHSSDAAGLSSFLRWLASATTQEQASAQSARTFRNRADRYWPYWPLPHFGAEEISVLHVDGLHLGRKAVVLIATNELGQPVGWYLARSEHSQAWKALLAQTSQPVMVVTDGGSGFRKAMKEVWPDVRVQRCLFHVFMNITALTSKNPRLVPGRELKDLAHRLLAVKTCQQADQWEADYLEWEQRWKSFLAQTSLYANGQWEVTHQKLVRARNQVRSLLRQGQLFTFLSPDLLEASGLDALPSTNNRLEGGVNSPLRRMLANHRGMPLTHQIKAIFWWCYTHSPAPLPPAQILTQMPTDETIADLYNQARTSPTQKHADETGAPIRWGTAISWEDLHHRTWKW